jgi:hypothetical protein
LKTGNAVDLLSRARQQAGCSDWHAVFENGTLEDRVG